jgi:hypothetical protein
VASDTAMTSERESPPEFVATVKFDRVFTAEIETINKRRASDPPDSRGKIDLEVEAKDNFDERILRPQETANLVGLALSGGGIRSAAISGVR